MKHFSFKTRKNTILNTIHDPTLTHIATFDNGAWGKWGKKGDNGALYGKWPKKCCDLSYFQ